MKITTRLCALCDTIIPDNWIVCRTHFPDYQKYSNEVWFKELVMAQRRQFEIDNLESVMTSGKITKPYQKLTDSEKRAIKFLRSKGLGPRTISKVLGINADTLRSFIYHKTGKNNDTESYL